MLPVAAQPPPTLAALVCLRNANKHDKLLGGHLKLIRSPCRHIYLTVRDRVTLVKHGAIKQGMRLV